MFLSLALMFIAGLSTGIFLSMCSLGLSLYLKESSFEGVRGWRLGRKREGEIVGGQTISFADGVFTSVPTGVVTTPDGNFYGDIFSNQVIDDESDDSV